MRAKPSRPVTRVVVAPTPNFPPGTPLPANRVGTVVLRPDEEVEWLWTARPDGAKYVSAYRIHRTAARRTVTLTRRVKFEEPSAAAPPDPPKPQT